MSAQRTTHKIYEDGSDLAWEAYIEWINSDGQDAVAAIPVGTSEGNLVIDTVRAAFLGGYAKGKSSNAR